MDLGDLAHHIHENTSVMNSGWEKSSDRLRPSGSPLGAFTKPWPRFDLVIIMVSLLETILDFWATWIGGWAGQWAFFALEIFGDTGLGRSWTTAR